MDISIIIVNWNTRELLRNCLDSVEATVRGLSYEIIVVDNASVDGSAAMVRQGFPNVRLIENPENRGFGAANNQALRVMTGRYALLLNSDAVLTENAVSELFACMENHPEAAMACSQLLNTDGSRQNSIAAFPSLLTLMTNTPLLEYLFPRRFPSKRYSHSGPVEVDSGIGACLMVRRVAMDAVGLFDERYHFFFEETDWAYQMRRAGWKVLYVPTAFVYHLQGQSIGRNLHSRIEFYRSRYQFFRKWRSGPYYWAIRVVIPLRLVPDWLLASAGMILTLGLMRELRDKWAVYGRLLVWHLKGCPWPMKIAERFSKPSQISRILIIQLGDIGDVVLATPTVRAVKEAYPHALVSIMVRKPCGSLLAADPNLHEVVEVSKVRGSALHVMKEHVKFTRRLRRMRYDLVIDLRTDDRGAIMSFLTGARERVGRRCAKPFWRDLLFTRILDDTPAAPPPVHPGADQSLRIVRAIGIDTNDSTPKLHISSNDREYAERILTEHGLLPDGRWFTLNPFSRWKYKEWNDEKWEQVINSLRERFNIPVLLIGSPQEYSAAESIVSRCNGGAHNLTGGSIGEMAAIIATSSLHIGVDSAAPHIAAALGIPTVTIHGPQDWRAWRANDDMNKIITPQMECVPCNRKGCDDSGKSQCMKQLEADAVLHEIDRVLSVLKEIH